MKEEEILTSPTFGGLFTLETSIVSGFRSCYLSSACGLSPEPKARGRMPRRDDLLAQELTASNGDQIPLLAHGPQEDAQRPTGRTTNYFAHDKTGAHDRGCCLRHGQQMRYFSYMGRREIMVWYQAQRAEERRNTNGEGGQRGG